MNYALARRSNATILLYPDNPDCGIFMPDGEPISTRLEDVLILAPSSAGPLATTKVSSFAELMAVYQNITGATDHKLFVLATDAFEISKGAIWVKRTNRPRVVNALCDAHEEGVYPRLPDLRFIIEEVFHR